MPRGGVPTRVVYPPPGKCPLVGGNLFSFVGRISWRTDGRAGGGGVAVGTVRAVPTVLVRQEEEENGNRGARRGRGMCLATSRPTQEENDGDDDTPTHTPRAKPNERANLCLLFSSHPPH
jgi:hypothetical protein